MENNRRIALVTGGVGGIGAAICRRLAKDGCSVVVADLDAAAAKELAAALPDGPHLGLAADVTEEESAECVFTEIEAALGPVSILVTCAGILILRPDGSRNPIAEMSAAEWRRTQDINVEGTFFYGRAFARRAAKVGREGRVITLASVAAQLGGYRSSSAYITSKAAVIGFTKSLARELAPHGATANSIAPGLIDTDMLRLFLPTDNDAQAAQQIPLGRIGAPEDVAGAVSYLASADASYVTGVTIDVNGGYRMQ